MSPRAYRDDVSSGSFVLLREAALAKTKEPPQTPAEPKETTPEFIASMASVLVIGIFIITFCLQAFEIPSSSMEKTLLIGDYLLVDKAHYAKPGFFSWLFPYSSVKRQDIVEGWERGFDT